MRKRVRVYNQCVCVCINQGHAHLTTLPVHTLIMSFASHDLYKEKYASDTHEHNTNKITHGTYLLNPSTLKNQTLTSNLFLSTKAKYD